MQRRIVHAVVVDEVVVALHAAQAQGLHDVEVRLFLGLPRPVRGILAAGQAQLAPERHVRVAVVLRLDGAAAAHDGVGGAVVGDDGGTLQRAGRREHVVREQGRRGHPVVHDHQELALLERLQRHLGVAVGVDGVRGVHDERAHLVGVARDDGLEHARAVGLAEPLGGQRLAPRALRVVRDQLVAGPGGQLELVGADLLGLLLLGQALVELHLLVGEVVERGARHAVAAGDVEVAADGAHEGDGVAAGGGGTADLVPRAAPLDAAGGIHSVQARSLADLLGIEPRDGRGPLGRVLGHMLLQLLEAVAPLAHELPVDQALVDDGVQHGQRERGVGAGTQRQPQVGLGGRLGVARVHDHDLQAVLLQVGVAVHAAQRGGTGVHAPEDEALGAGEVRLERRPAGHAGLGHERGDPAQKGVVEAVRRAELVQEAAARPVVGARRAARRGHGLGAALVLDLVEAVGNLLDRLVVRDLLPLALALGTHALQRVVDAGGVVDVQQRARAAAAQSAMVRVIGIAFDLDYVAILNVGEHAAVSMAEIAERLDHRDAVLMDVDLGRHGIRAHKALETGRRLGNLHLPSPLLLVRLPYR